MLEPRTDPTTPATSGVSDVLNAVSLHSRMTHEWHRWERALPPVSGKSDRRTHNPFNRVVYPALDAVDAFPTGWSVESISDEVFIGRRRMLLRRESGGWALVETLEQRAVGWSRTNRARAVSRRVLLTTSPTLGGLYRAAVRFGEVAAAEVAAGRRYTPGTPVWDLTAAWLTTTIIPLFDAVDPDEAAEQMLVAMGQPLTRLPRAAQ